jgi:hypothetical protein
LLASGLSASVTSEAIELLPILFGTSSSEGVLMAVRAAGTDEDPATIAASLVALAQTVTDDPRLRPTK